MPVQTRSTFEGEHKALSYNPDPVWINLSDFYHSHHHNGYEVVMNERTREDRDLVKKKWEALQPVVDKKRKNEMRLYTLVREKSPSCVFFGYETDPQTKLEALLDRSCDWIQRIRFENKQNHIQGFCDALGQKTFLQDFFRVLLPEDDQAPYVILLLSSSLPTKLEIPQLHAAALLTFFQPGDTRISRRHVVLMDSTGNTKVLCVEHPEKLLRPHLSYLRKVKTWAPLYDLANPPPILYPNMKAQGRCEMPWNTETWETAVKVGEITLLWNCTDRIKQLCSAKGIYSWRDEKFTPEALGWVGQEKVQTLKRILEVNRASDGWNMFIDDTLWEQFPEMLDERGPHLFVDFEYIGNDVYMIGTWDQQKKEYKAFWNDELDTPVDVSPAWKAFIDYLGGYDNPTIWYWYAEKKMAQKIGAPVPTSHWKDLCQVARKTAVKDAFDFSLKSFVRAFRRYGKIPFSYTDLECQNGENSISMAQDYFGTKDERIKETLEAYNRMDCEAMFYIFQEIQNKK